MLVSGSFAGSAFLDRLKSRSAEVERQFAFLRRYFTPRTVFMHFGAHDCALALQAAGYVERVYAVDPVQDIARGLRLPCNLRFVDSRDLWTVGENTVDVGFSERLPVSRLRELRKSLAPRGIHVFQSSDKRETAHEPLRAAGFSGMRTNFLANLLHNPRLLTAVK
jgi:hypothetical protein